MLPLVGRLQIEIVNICHDSDVVKQRSSSGMIGYVLLRRNNLHHNPRAYEQSHMLTAQRL